MHVPVNSPPPPSAGRPVGGSFPRATCALVFASLVLVAPSTQAGDSRSGATVSGAGTAFSVVADDAPAVPAGLRGEIYSPTAAELFWSRSDTFGLRYEVRRDGSVLGETDGVSFFDNARAAGRGYRYGLIAIDRQGRRSAPAEVSLRNPGSGGGNGPASPAGLRASVYSATAAEIFWTRASTPGLRYEVRRDGTVLATGGGISYFDGQLAAGRDYRYEVIAIARDGRRSTASRVDVRTRGAGGQGTGGPGTGGPGGGGQFTEGSVDELLRQTFKFANAGVLVKATSRFDALFEKIFRLAFNAQRFGGPMSGEGVTLVDTDTAVNDSRFSVISRYTLSCDAGGSVIVDHISGPTPDFPVNFAFDRCALESGTYDGNYSSVRRNREGGFSDVFGDSDAEAGSPGASIVVEAAERRKVYGGQRDFDRSRGVSKEEVRWRNGRYASGPVGGKSVASFRDLDADVTVATQALAERFYIRLADGSIGGVIRAGKTIRNQTTFQERAPWTQGGRLSVTIDLTDGNGAFDWFDGDPGYPVSDLGERLPTSNDPDTPPEDNGGSFIEPEPLGGPRIVRGRIVIEANDGRGKLIVSSGEGEPGTFDVTVENTGETFTRAWADFPALCPSPLDCS